MPPAFHNWLSPRGMPRLQIDADIAIVDFAIIADVTNDAHGPILGEAEFLAIAALRSRQSA